MQIVVSTQTAGHHYIILVDIKCTTQPVMKPYKFYNLQVTLAIYSNTRPFKILVILFILVC